MNPAFVTLAFVMYGRMCGYPAAVCEAGAEALMAGGVAALPTGWPALRSALVAAFDKAATTTHV